jgi:predicted permease
MGRLIVPGAFRPWVRRPALALAIVLLAAVAVGANVAVFSLVNGALLRPLPFAEPARLVQVRESHQSRRANLTGATFRDLVENSQSLTALGSWRLMPYNLSGAAEPEQVAVATVSGSFFEVLGVRPLAGRGLSPRDIAEQPAVIVLGFDLWMRRFGGDPDVIGTIVRLDSQPYEVVGIMPRGLRYPGGAAAWSPVGRSAEFPDNRRAHLFVTIARMAAHVSVRQVRDELNGIGRAIEAKSGSTDPHLRFDVEPLQHSLSAEARPMLMILGTASLCLLLVAVGNIAGLLLSFGSTRQREFAIRIALGAARSRLLSESVLQGTVLFLVSGAAGLPLGLWGARLLLAYAPLGLPATADVSLDWRVTFFCASSTLVSGVLASMLPAWQSSRHLDGALRERRSTGRRGRAQSAVVVLQIALSLVLLAGAGVLGRSFLRLVGVDPGFSSEGILTFSVSLPRTIDRAQRDDVLDQILEHLRALPGTAEAAATGSLPLTSTPATTMRIDGLIAAEESSAQIVTVSPGFFSALRIPVTRGRAFTERDRPGQPTAVVVNEAFVGQYLRGGSAVGRRVTMLDWGAPLAGEIVGVVADVRQGALDSPPPPIAYYALRQFPESTLQTAFVVRSANTQSGRPDLLARPISAAVRAVDPDLPVASLQTMEQVLSATVADRRAGLWLVGLLGLAALVLAAAGLYALFSYHVAQRTFEIGLRMALGAQRSAIVGMFMTGGARLTAVGIVAGAGGAYAMSSMLTTLVFGVAPFDPLSLVAAASVLVAVMIIASVAPAARAARIDPAVTLRTDLT